MILQENRHQIILDKLDKQGVVIIGDLANMMSVTEMTIRRDLTYLESKGLLKRVHGGAVSDHGRSYEPPLLKRASQFSEEKGRIGKAAAALVNNGDSIILDVGTTVLEVCKNLLDFRDLTIITSSFPILSLLVERTGIRVIASGGIIRPGELSMIGYLAENSFSNFHVDKLFLGAGGVDINVGLTEYNLEDSLVKKAMIKCAKETILVVDSSKFHHIAFATICNFKDIQTIVTDKKLDIAIYDKLKNTGIQVILA